MFNPILYAGKERERRLIECRKTAEERKNYFESMERHMFNKGSAVKETGRESISTSQEQVSIMVISYLQFVGAFFLLV